jgi:acylphosphatase
MKTYRFLFYGKVQGVSFRKFTKQTADNFKLGGWVRNLSDGRVEAMIAADDTILDKLCEILNRGPADAVVKKAIVEEANDKINNHEFVILPTI